MSMIPIASQTVSGSSTQTITFSNIPQTFTHLELRSFTQTSSATTYVYFRLNGDSGTNYSWHELQGDGASALSFAGSSQNLGVASDGIPQSTTSSWSASVGQFLDYTNTNKNKTYRAICGADRNGSGLTFLVSSAWYSTAAITSIALSLANGNYTAGSRFDLYGITNSPATGA